MKRFVFLQLSICLLAVSCSVQEFDIQDAGTSSQDVFYAYLESYSEPDTKVYVNEKLKILWDAKDRISIFNKYTYNFEYEFMGATGDNAGKFEITSNPFVAGNDLDYIYAVYPYHEKSTNISNSGVLTLVFPAEQIYREDSFGPGANTMVSVTKENPLMFKNAGGYLLLKMYGKDVSVSSITLEGRNREPLSGEATWKPTTIGAKPDFSFTSTEGTSIKLTSDNPVKLGNEKETATVFWIVVPPTTFEKGFKLTVTGTDGASCTKETDMKQTIARNTLLRMAPFEVTFD